MKPEQLQKFYNMAEPRSKDAIRKAEERKKKKKDKELLLKDLCARLPYKVIVEIKSYGQETQKPWFGELSCKDLDCFLHDVAYKSIKPYLRPMSSMSEEEKKEYTSYCFEQPFLQKGKTPNLGSVPMCIDWLNKNMFDFRGLIPKDLALSTDEFNPYVED